jgi:hypothetical protein
VANPQQRTAGNIRSRLAVAGAVDRLQMVADKTLAVDGGMWESIGDRRRRRRVDQASISILARRTLVLYSRNQSRTNTVLSGC